MSIRVTKFGGTSLASAEQFRKVKEIIKPAECRVTPKCKTQKDCLGCPLMIMDYKAQLDCKLQLVKDTFKKYMPEHFADDMLDYIVDKAIEYKLGARGLRGLMETVMMDVMYELPSSKKRKKTYEVTKEYAAARIEKTDVNKLSN